MRAPRRQRNRPPRAEQLQGERLFAQRAAFDADAADRIGADHAAKQRALASPDRLEERARPLGPPGPAPSRDGEGHAELARDFVDVSERGGGDARAEGAGEALGEQELGGEVVGLEFDRPLARTEPGARAVEALEPDEVGVEQEVSELVRDREARAGRGRRWRGWRARPR